MFSPGEMVTPDQVRGKHKILEEAVLQDQWPTLAKTRGKVVFLMDQRTVGDVYLEGHAALRGPAIFWHQPQFLASRTARLAGPELDGDAVRRLQIWFWKSCSWFCRTMRIRSRPRKLATKASSRCGTQRAARNLLGARLSRVMSHTA